VAAVRAVIAGFYGKLPARGDFVRAALPRDFTERWDGWLAPAIAGSRDAMGEDWLPCFLEAPVWRFALAAGLCGERAVLGLMLPSVDRAGRYFPLTFAALFDGAIPADDPTWLDRCEAAGLAALDTDLAPDDVAAMLGPPPDGTAAAAFGDGRSLWWTEGAPRVAPARFALPGLPDAGVYATMLGATPAGPASPASVPAGATMPEAAGFAAMADLDTTPAGTRNLAAPTGEKSWEPPS
jgi:type VI secretion system protein ImpM